MPVPDNNSVNINDLPVLFNSLQSKKKKKRRRKGTALRLIAQSYVQNTVWGWDKIQPTLLSSDYA